MNAAESRRLDESDEQREQSDPSIIIVEEDEQFQSFEETDRKPKMSDYLRKPEVLKMDGNMSDNWRRWKRSYDCYFDAAELGEKTDKVKISILLNMIGPDAVETYDSFNLSELEAASYTNVVKAFDDFCKPKQNTVYERFVFNERKQKDGEPFDAFHRDIKRLIRTCQYGDQENEMLRDRIVIGVNDKKLQARLLETIPLTYESAVEKCRTSEVTKEQANEMNKTASVNEIKHVVDRNRKQRTYNDERRGNNNNKRNSTDTRSKGKFQNRRSNDTQTGNNTNKSNNMSKVVDNCKFCNLSHRMGSKFCPAFGQTCNTCKKKNHYSSVCKTVDAFCVTNYTSDEYDFNDNDEFEISTLDKVNTEVTDDAVSYPWLEKITVNDDDVDCKVDTGAEVDVLPMKVLKRIAPKAVVQMTAITLRAFGGQRVKPIGTCTLLCHLNDITLKIKFAVVDNDITPILSLKSCIRFKLINRSKLKKKSHRNMRRSL